MPFVSCTAWTIRLLRLHCVGRSTATALEPGYSEGLHRASGGRGRCCRPHGSPEFSIPLQHPSSPAPAQPEPSCGGDPARQGSGHCQGRPCPSGAGVSCWAVGDWSELIWSSGHQRARFGQVFKPQLGSHERRPRNSAADKQILGGSCCSGMYVYTVCHDMQHACLDETPLATSPNIITRTTVMFHNTDDTAYHHTLNMCKHRQRHPVCHCTTYRRLS